MEEDKQLKLSENAIKVLERRYFAKDEDGTLLENAEGMFRRVARSIAQADLNFDPNADVKALEDAFYNRMVNLEFMPNSPTLMNAGRPIGPAFRLLCASGGGFHGGNL